MRICLQGWIKGSSVMSRQIQHSAVEGSEPLTTAASRSTAAVATNSGKSWQNTPSGDLYRRHQTLLNFLLKILKDS